MIDKDNITSDLNVLLISEIVLYAIDLIKDHVMDSIVIYRQYCISPLNNQGTLPIGNIPILNLNVL